MGRHLGLIIVGFVLATTSGIAQTTLSKQPLWFAGTGDCNHALFNNVSTPCGQTSPTGSNDSEYIDYYEGLVFQPRISGSPSYFTNAGNLILQGTVGIGTTSPQTPLDVGQYSATSLFAGVTLENTNGDGNYNSPMLLLGSGG